MKKFILTASLALLSAPALASDPASVPETNAGAGVAAIALLAGAAAIIRERMKRK